MRVVHISDCYAPRVGGIESQVVGLTEFQHSSGVEVDVLTATPYPGESHGRTTSVRVVRFSGGLPFSTPFHLRARSLIRERLLASPVDVVHAHIGTLSPFSLSGVRVARDLGIPTVVTIHSMWDWWTRAFYCGLRLSPWSLAGGPILTSVGSTAASRVQRAVARSTRVVANGIDVEAWRLPRDVDSGEATRQRPLTVVSVLRMAPRKRAVPLLRVLRSVLAERPDDIEAIVVGDGPNFGRSRRFLDRYELTDRVRLVGWRSPEEIRKIFSRSDVFLQSSIREAFGIAALEARASGLAVVARSQSGTRDFIDDGREGLLAQDDAGLAEAVLRLAGNRQLLEHIHLNNRESPVRYAWSHVGSEIERLYREAVEGGRGALG